MQSHFVDINGGNSFNMTRVRERILGEKAYADNSENKI